MRLQHSSAGQRVVEMNRDRRKGSVMERMIKGIHTAA